MPASPLHKLYTLLPLTAITKTWGALTSTTIPSILRVPIYSFYSSIFACNLTEMMNPLASYPTLGEFFYRELKKGARTIDVNASMVSPADGLLTHFGVCEGDKIEQVKGLTYSLNHLLDGKVQDYSKYDGLSSANSTTSRYKFNKKGETDLYYAVIYLGPGDYHRFHSPLNWSLERIKSFSGELYSVNPAVVKWLRGVFALNSRVVYEGSWKNGYMAMVAVGATNVGTIVVDSEVGKIAIGDEMGGFRLGSSIVLVFEGEKGLVFVDEKDKLRVGQRLIREK